MRIPRFFIGACAAFLLAAFVTSNSEAKSLPAPADRGIQLFLTTSAYEVNVSNEWKPSKHAALRRLPVPAIAASVRLVNRSNSDIVFQIPGDNFYSPRFNFRVLNETGKEVWNSEWPLVPEPAGLMEVVLPKKSKWDSGARIIPLRFGELTMPSGRYTLEAAVAGESGIRGTTVFQVTGGMVNPPNTGIRGRVFRPSSPSEEPVPQAGALITVMPFAEQDQAATGGTIRIRSGLTTVTDADGTFEIETPAGQFEVSASVRSPKPLVPVGTARLGTNAVGMPILLASTRTSGLATVESGNYSEIQLQFEEPFPINRELINRVDEVALRALPTFAPPTMIELTAQGTVTTSGWSSPLLKMRRVRDGFVEFEYLAEPPLGVSAQVLTPISATTTFQQPANFKGVRVYSATNSKEAGL